jgi:RNA 3'-terminal phosphate cyclase (ATP)
MKMIEIDGSQGEGGGQILRSSLSLSMITGQSFRIGRVRAGRNKPGLLRQHLTAVAAAKEICGADVEGAVPGSQEITFRPGRIRAGDYRFAIGTAGSSTLVLQAILPALWFADGPSTVAVSGGTHNPAAPPADFVIHSWLPLVQRMGVDCAIELVRHGFYPAGGGEISAHVNPCQKLSPLSLVSRGDLLAAKAISVIAGIPSEVAERELDRISMHFEGIPREVRTRSSREGPGNVLMVELTYPELTEVFSSFGERGLAAEAVADRLAREVKHFQVSPVVVDEHLADQLVLPIALAGKGSFVTTKVSSHLATNLQVIAKFLPLQFEVLTGAESARISL